MVAKHRIAGGRPTQVHCAAVGRAGQICGRRDHMHAQSGITHQRDVDLTGATIDLVLVQAAGQVVLGQTRAVANWLTQGHVVKKPVRPPGPRGGQAITGQGQDRAQHVVFGVPIPQPTAEKKREHRFNIILHQLGRGPVVIAVRVAQPADTGKTPGAAAVRPEIIVRAKSRNPCPFGRKSADIGGAKE